MKLKQNFHGLKVRGNLTLIGQGFFEIFRFGGGDGICQTHHIIFVVCGPVAKKFFTGLKIKALAQVWKKMHKVKDVIIARMLAEKTVKRSYFETEATSYIQSY